MRLAGLGADVKEVINCWSTVEAAGVKNPKFGMQDHYSDAYNMMGLHGSIPTLREASASQTS